jgi:hypothetical protein
LRDKYLAHSDNLQTLLGPRGANSVEARGASRDYTFDQTEEWLPGFSVRVTDSMPQQSGCVQSNYLKTLCGARAGNFDEARGTSRHYTFDQTEEWLPGSVGVANGVPQVRVTAQSNYLKTLCGARAGNTDEAWGTSGHYTFDQSEERLPGFPVRVTDGVP